jgi:hypothetical protein
LSAGSTSLSNYTPHRDCSQSALGNSGRDKAAGGDMVDFVGDNRVIFDLGGDKYRLVVHVSITFGRVLVKFIGTHAAYDRIDPEPVSWRKKMIRPIRSETDYDATLNEIERTSRTNRSRAPRRPIASISSH